MSEQQALPVSNPIQASSEVFYRPHAVFTTIGKVNNWSWVPFIIVTVFATVPVYLFYNTVDLTWLIDQVTVAGNPDASPAEIDNIKAQTPEGFFKYSYIGVPIGFIVINAIIAAFYTFATRNDDENVQGFTDWYGACWWMSMPVIINGLIACFAIVMQDSGAQFPPSYTAPLSLAFIFGVEISSEAFNLLTQLRLDTIWSLFLATYCVKAWTSFSLQKSFIIAIIPTLVFIGISFIIYLV